MDTKITIRPAKLEDLVALSQVFDAYRVFYQLKSDLNLATRFLEQRLIQQDSSIFIAENEQNELLGFTQLYPIFSSFSGQRAWLLNDLFVYPASRKQGLGERLLQRAIAYGHETQASEILLETATNNHIAQALYQKMGFVQDQTYLTFAYDLTA